MVDRLSKESRSKIMSSIRSKETKPEKLLRSLLHKEGYRFRKNYPKLPGKPDIVFTKKKKIIFVHGCFWHNHGCSNGQIPTSRVSYWKTKLQKNKERDRALVKRLQEEGWGVLEIWECELLGDMSSTIKRSMKHIDSLI